MVEISQASRNPFDIYLVVSILVLIITKFKRRTAIEHLPEAFPPFCFDEHEMSTFDSAFSMIAWISPDG